MNERKPLIEGRFKLIKLDSIIWKNITDRAGVRRDLLEFWVENQGKQVHCVVWDKVANILKDKLEDNPISEISLSYFEKFNRIADRTEYVVCRFKV